MFSQEPNGKWADGPSDSLYVWGWRGGVGVFPVGVGDLGVAVREDRDGFLGEKPLEIGRAAQGASQRWEEAGRRKFIKVIIHLPSVVGGYRGVTH